MTTEQARQAYLNEVGTMPPCPFCQKPRVQRSDYVRCNPCGINWLAGEDLNRNPKAERWEKFLAAARSTRNTSSTATEPGSGAPTAGGLTR